MLSLVHGAYFYVLVCSLLLGMLLTPAVRRLALRFGVLDHPSGRKDHREPTPLLGGLAIFLCFHLVIGAHLAAFYYFQQTGIRFLYSELVELLGENAFVQVTGILAGGLVVFILGVVDDVRHLTPWVKLLGQFAAGGILLLSGIQIKGFIFENDWLSYMATLAWVVLIVNSLNLLDNMDGLCGGVSIIAALSFFLAVNPDDYLVRLVLMAFVGAVGGFLYHNFHPARIFMGDAGSMFCGYMLATIAVLGTYHTQTTPSPVAVAAPLVALSVPLFDTLSVVYIRWRLGHPLMQGDKRHFSHRLVDLGMSTRQAVTFIYLVGGVCGLGAALLPHLDFVGTGVVLVQILGIYMLVILLMNVQKNGVPRREK